MSEENRYVYINIQKRNEDGSLGDRFGSATDKTSIFPLWRLWVTMPDVMFCPAGTTTPCDNLYINLATTGTDKVQFDAIAWRKEHEDLRQELLALVPCN